MGANVYDKVKRIQSNIQKTRPKVFQVENTRKSIVEINQYIKDILQNDAHLALPQFAKSSAVDGVRSVNRLFEQLFQECRSDEHFALHKAYFQAIINKIHKVSQGVHIAVESGYHQIENKGLTIYKSIELSWQSIMDFQQSIQNLSTVTHAPLVMFPDFQFQSNVSQQAQAIKALAESAQKAVRSEGEAAYLSSATILHVDVYFKKVQEFRDFVQSEALGRLCSRKNLPRMETPDIAKLHHELQRVESGMRKYFLKLDNHNVYSDSYSEESLQIEYESLINSLYIHLEGFRILEERYNNLSKEKSDDILKQEDAHNSFYERIVKDQKQLNYLVTHLGRFNQSLFSAAGILCNLSISFGKIHLIAMKTTPSLDFTQRALSSVHQLLDRAMEFIDARKSDFLILEGDIQQCGLFHQVLSSGLVTLMSQLTRCRRAIEDYDNWLRTQTASINNNVTIDQFQPRRIIQEAYQEHTQLSYVSVCLSSASQNFENLIFQLKQVNSIFKNLMGLKMNESVKAGERVEQILEVLEIESKQTDDFYKQFWLRLQHLDWYTENILNFTLFEEARYAEELQEFLTPVFLRQKHNELSKQAKEQKLLEIEKAKERAEQLKQEKIAKGEDPDDPATISKNFIKAKQKRERSKVNEQYMPFRREIMEGLLKALKGIGSEKAMMLFDVLKAPHAVFVYLSHLEKQFEPNSPQGEGFYLDAIYESQSARDFILGFMHMKFMPYGYFDLNGQPIPYNKARKQFEPQGSTEYYMRFTMRTLETPMHVFKKLLRIMLGFDDLATLHFEEHEKIIEFVKEDHMLTPEEQRQLQDSVPFCD